MLGVWEVPLEGDATVLKRLSGKYLGGQAEIAQSEGKIALVFDRKEGEGAGEVMERAQGIAHHLSGLARIHLASPDPIETEGVVIPVSPAGDRGVIVFVKPTELRLRGQQMGVETDGSTSSTPEELVQRDLHTAMGDPEVEKGLRLWNRAEDPSWGDMYKVFEVIKGDCGTIPKGWASRDEIRTFRHTANSVGAIADEARHGIETTAPPPVPMRRSAAKSF